MIESLLGRLAALDFTPPTVTAETPPVVLHQAILAHAALGNVAATRDCIARVWQAMNYLEIGDAERDNMLWDVAVREAQTWASEGHLDYALADLEAWRHCAPIQQRPGHFEMRAMGVCLAAGNAQQALAYQRSACEADPANELYRLDLALLEARMGSVESARDLLASIAPGRLMGMPKLYAAFIEGILACRSHAPDAAQRLATALDEYLPVVEGNPAGWSLLSIWCGWWALALADAGDGARARELLRLVAPIFMTPTNRELIVELKKRQVLPEDTLLPSLALDATTKAAATPTDHGTFKTVRSRGVNALKRVEAYRREFAQGSRLYPFLIGTDEELEQLLETLTTPEDGGQAQLEAARRLDIGSWLEEHMPEPPKSWPKKAFPAPRTPLIQFDSLSQLLKPEILIGLIELEDPAELFARIGYGDWNGCPEPHLHTALHAYWRERFGAEPVAVSGDTVECVVTRPPTEKPASLALAREQQAYCSDIVEQGVGTTAKLASSLRAAKYWYFWWD